MPAQHSTCSVAPVAPRVPVVVFLLPGYRLPQLSVSLPGGRGAGGGDGPCPSSAGPCPWPGLGPWGQTWRQLCYKAAEAAEAGEVLAAGVILGLAGHPGSCFSWKSAGRTLKFYFWALPFLPLCFLPSLARGWEERPSGCFWEAARLLGLLTQAGPLGLVSSSLSSDFWGQRVSLITSQDLTLGSKFVGKAEGKPWCQTPWSAIVLSP